jgi:hypothetical protein
MPDSIEERNRLIDEVVFQGLPDIAERPEYWVPFDATTVAAIRSRQVALSDALLDDSADAEAALLLKRYGPDLLVVPLTAKDNSVALVFDTILLKPVGTLNVDPWELAKAPKKDAAEAAAE